MITYKVYRGEPQTFHDDPIPAKRRIKDSGLPDDTACRRHNKEGSQHQGSSYIDSRDIVVEQNSEEKASNRTENQRSPCDEKCLPEYAVEFREMLECVNFQKIGIVIESRKRSRDIGSGEVPTQEGVDDGQQEWNLGHYCNKDYCRQDESIIIFACIHRASHMVDCTRY
ncbi:hypothetical protein SDC9_192409 [bioreactor metagenome]|uniref:Uncharacterized protein n=1 Tax=bioreactor metagenome TaxID=1076179 RepID=A0A645I268_9ZZZZ